VSIIGTNINVDDASFKVGGWTIQGKWKARNELKLEPQAFEFAFKADRKARPIYAFARRKYSSQLSGEVKADGKLTGDFRNFKGNQ